MTRGFRTVHLPKNESSTRKRNLRDEFSQQLDVKVYMRITTSLLPYPCAPPRYVHTNKNDVIANRREKYVSFSAAFIKVDQTNEGPAPSD
jgi:hypothetical protein